jgi:hypothetical protein
MLTVEQDGKKQAMPACNDCWKECIESEIKITEAKPI